MTMTNRNEDTAAAAAAASSEISISKPLDEITPPTENNNNDDDAWKETSQSKLQVPGIMLTPTRSESPYFDKNSNSNNNNNNDNKPETETLQQHPTTDTVDDLEQGQQQQRQLKGKVIEYSTSTTRSVKGKRKKYLLIGFLISILIGAAAGLTGYLLMSSNSSNDRKKASTSNAILSSPTMNPTISNRPTLSKEPSDGPSIGPTLSPTSTPSSTPSYTPTISPSLDPTSTPSFQPTISVVPSSSPSTAPTRDYRTMLQDFLFEEYAVDTTSTTSNILAIEWLAQEAAIGIGGEQQQTVLQLNQKLVQRFALLSLDFALQQNNADNLRNIKSLNARVGIDACQWNGIVCNDDDDDNTMISEINWSYQQQEGVGGIISKEIRLLSSSLLKLDFSNNNLVGTIPEELYKLTNIQKVYLFKNNLTGTISSQIGNLDSITHFHLSHNNLIGNIPNELKSDNNGIRPLEYFNVYSNQLTGTIPDDLRLRNVIYFDIGRNSLTGKLPNDIGTKFISLRHLYLDHNDFRGTIPDSYNTVGNGRLESFSIDHNRFTGTVPGERSMYNKLVQYTLHSNQFDRIDSDNCRIEVPQGECVEFRADCDVCQCNGYFDLCDRQCHQD